MTPRTRAFAGRIVERLHRARALCPTFGATYCVAGQLERFVLERPEGAAGLGQPGSRRPVALLPANADRTQRFFRTSMNETARARRIPLAE